MYFSKIFPSQSVTCLLFSMSFLLNVFPFQCLPFLMSSILNIFPSQCLPISMSSLLNIFPSALVNTRTPISFSFLNIFLPALVSTRTPISFSFLRGRNFSAGPSLANIKDSTQIPSLSSGNVSANLFLVNT